MLKVSKFKTLKNLSRGLRKKSGRNALGRLTIAHKGGGHKQKIRFIDWKRQYVKKGFVINLEYDPTKSSFLAKIAYKNKNKIKYSYILAPQKINFFDMVEKITSFKKTRKIGNFYLLKHFEIGDLIHNIEIVPGGGGRLVRSAGTYAEILQHIKTPTKTFVKLKLPSGEERLLNGFCSAIYGTLINENHCYNIIGKAGRSRWLNKRPTVRGVAMNPIDHPHGGGEGKTSGGRPSVTPQGRPTKGQKTVVKKNKYILKHRK